jgi:hypothetical protein
MKAQSQVTMAMYCQTVIHRMNISHVVGYELPSSLLFSLYHICFVSTNNVFMWIYEM